MPPRMKSAVNRPSKRGRSIGGSSSRQERPPPSPPSSPSHSSSSSPSSSSLPPTSMPMSLKPNAQMLTDMKKRLIMVERRTLRSVIEGHETAIILAQINWSNILDWGDKAYPSLVYSMYASITDAVSTIDSCSFNVAFRNQVVTIDPDRISSVMNIPVCENGLTMVADTLTEAEKAEATLRLCGFNAEWNRKKNFLPLGSLIPKYRLLHNLFTFNVYPRKGNRTELTAYMVNILHKVITGVPICLPSLICRTIVRFHLSNATKTAAPFGFLMTQLARSYGVPRPTDTPLSHAPFGRANLIQMNLLPNAEAGPVPPLADDQVPQQPAPSVPPVQVRGATSSGASRSVGDRLDAIEQRQSKTEKLLKKTLRYLGALSKGCRGHDFNEMPPSPSPPSD
ncbi:hypothetical protein AAC387_Pa12g1467 [Persea americana]